MTIKEFYPHTLSSIDVILFYTVWNLFRFKLFKKKTLQWKTCFCAQFVVGPFMDVLAENWLYQRCVILITSKLGFCFSILQD